MALDQVTTASLYHSKEPAHDSPMSAGEKYRTASIRYARPSAPDDAITSDRRPRLTRYPAWPPATGSRGAKEASSSVMRRTSAANYQRCGCAGAVHQIRMSSGMFFLMFRLHCRS
jgi:hypothetical protein